MGRRWTPHHDRVADEEQLVALRPGDALSLSRTNAVVGAVGSSFTLGKCIDAMAC
jgi:hypothetical protein